MPRTRADYDSYYKSRLDPPVPPYTDCYITMTNGRRFIVRAGDETRTRIPIEGGPGWNPKR